MCPVGKALGELLGYSLTYKETLPVSPLRKNAVRPSPPLPFVHLSDSQIKPRFFTACRLNNGLVIRGPCESTYRLFHRGSSSSLPPQEKKRFPLTFFPRRSLKIALTEMAMGEQIWTLGKKQRNRQMLRAQKRASKVQHGCFIRLKWTSLILTLYLESEVIKRAQISH